MTIQFNTDKNLTVHEGFNSKLTEMLNKGLDRFRDHISRLEVHLSDENGQKNGLNDKRCLLEARVQGRTPVAVTADEQTHELAVKAAILKLKNSLDTVFGRMQDR